jgi:adenylosuccinate synthase
MEWGQSFIVTDLGYGDAGKGTITDAMVRYSDAELIVRFNGGAQAAHTVVSPEGKLHTFNQFGSGTLSKGTKTFLSAFMLFNPLAIIHEQNQLRNIGIYDGYSRLYVDREALVTTPYHVYANRIREYARGKNKHGSCGMGIGETRSDNIEHPRQSIRAGDLLDRAVLTEKLRWHRDLKQKQLKDEIAEMKKDRKLPNYMARNIDWLVSEQELEDAIEVFLYVGKQINIVRNDFLHDTLSGGKNVVFEGAQGVLLDEKWGFYPFTTWTNTTSDNAIHMLQEVGYPRSPIVIGVTRAYMTRHGQGPLVTEDSELTSLLPDDYNVLNRWQGGFRVGWLDMVALKYALQVAPPVDLLAITCLDRLLNVPKWKICESYDYRGQELEKIRCQRPFNLGYQEKLTKIISKCRPLYQELSSSYTPQDYAKAVSALLNIPIGICSFGRSFNEKFVDALGPSEDHPLLESLGKGGKYK